MEVGPDTPGVRREKVGFGRQLVGVLYDGLHRRVDVVQLVLSVDVRYVARVQNVVQVLQKCLVLDLYANHIYCRLCRHSALWPLRTCTI